MVGPRVRGESKGGLYIYIYIVYMYYLYTHPQKPYSSCRVGTSQELRQRSY